MTDTHPIKRQPVPRGIAHTGPVILAYGFRPFFLGAGFALGSGGMAMAYAPADPRIICAVSSSFISSRPDPNTPS